MEFEAYLISKKIDSALFLKAEGDIWNAWKSEFDQLHPNSFTSQKLYLINPIRRKYPLKEEPVKKEEVKKADVVVKPVVKAQPVEPTAKSDSDNEVTPTPEIPVAKPVTAKPAVPRPVFKPKPKTT